MKRYTTIEQTTKLIELGFEKPRCEIKAIEAEGTWDWYEYAYSIGELIGMLPESINVFYDLSILSNSKGWWVLYGMRMIGDGDMWSIEHEVYGNELADALYEMIVKLKEEGVL